MPMNILRLCHELPGVWRGWGERAFTLLFYGVYTSSLYVCLIALIFRQPFYHLKAVWKQPAYKIYLSSQNEVNVSEQSFSSFLESKRNEGINTFNIASLLTWKANVLLAVLMCVSVSSLLPSWSISLPFIRHPFLELQGQRRADSVQFLSSSNNFSIFSQVSRICSSLKKILYINCQQLK